MTDPAGAIAEAVARWDLRVGDAFEPGATAWVAPATTPSGDDVVLKVLRRHPEGEGEAIGLRAWDGDGAIRLLDGFDRPTELVMLLERCIPGTPLRDRPEPEQDKVIARLLPRLWRAEVPEGVPSLVDMCAYWVDDFTPDPDVLDPGVARLGVELFRSLPLDAPAQVLLATDLHAGNVLASTREPWLMIDPKPHVGDPTYDVLQHLLNCIDRLVADPFRLVQRMADLVGLDDERLERWLLARCVLATKQQPALASVAARLAAHRSSPRRTDDVEIVHAAKDDVALARRLSSWATLDGELVDHAADDVLRALAPSARLDLDAHVDDIVALPFDDASFDVVFANRILYHLHQIDTAVGELHRVLRPGGALVVITYAPGHLQELYDTIRPRPDDGYDDGVDAIVECFAHVDQRGISGVARFASVDDVAGAIAAWGDFSWFADVDVRAALADVPMPFSATYRHLLVVATKQQ